MFVFVFKRVLNALPRDFQGTKEVMGSSINFLFYFHITIYKSIDEYEKRK